MTLLEWLRAYAPTRLPMHMPGGKRRFASDLPYQWDVTEVEGTDNLHEPSGILLQMQQRASSLWGAERSFVLVNGSTGGLLSAIRATGDGAILLARNCHRAVYNAVSLCRREVFYVLPTFLAPDLYGEVTPEAVEQALSAHPQITTVVLTSPTYEGVVSRIDAISRICHAHGATLLVDEAHGAHFGFHPAFPQSAVALGADIVVQSLHKTLPALTQTAILHCREQFAAAIARENAVFETSSPSYILLASADECFHFLQSEAGKQAFCAYADALLAVRKRLRDGLRHVRLLQEPNAEIGKLVIRTDGCDCTGVMLAKRLREEYAIETEMALPNELLAMTSVCDGEAEFSRFADALLSIDRTLCARGNAVSFPTVPLPERVFLPHEVREIQGEYLPIAQAVGQVALESVWAYPPGIPLLVPGERVPEGFPALMQAYEESGVSLHGEKGTLSEPFCVRTFPEQKAKNAVKNA